MATSAPQPSPLQSPGAASSSDENKHQLLNLPATSSVPEECKLDVCEANGVGARRRPVGLLDLQVGGSAPAIEPIDVTQSCPDVTQPCPQPLSSACSSSGEGTHVVSAPASARAIELAALVSPSVMNALSMHLSYPNGGCSPRPSPGTTPKAAIPVAINS